METGLDSMTGSRVKKIQSFVEDAPFFLTYGDGLSNIDLTALESFHKSKGKTLTVTGVRPPGRFGELQASVDGIVTEFNEKPQASDGLISGGFFVCEPQIFELLDNQEVLLVLQ